MTRRAKWVWFLVAVEAISVLLIELPLLWRWL
jgi:hypothetical protein